MDKWPIMNPNDVVFILATYLLFVLKIGPILMEGRNPLPLKGFLIFYNVIKVINSGVLAYKVYVQKRHCILILFEPTPRGDWGQK